MEVEQEATDGSSTGRLRPASVGVAVVAVVFALVTGVLAAWATANLGVSAIAFVAVGLLVGYLLWTKPITMKAVAGGLYYTALVLVLVPVLFYTPTIVGPTPAGAEGAGMFIGSILGLFIWGFVFLVIALVIAGVGYLVNKRADRKLSGE